MAPMAERPDPHGSDAAAGEHGQPADHAADQGHDDHGHGAGSALGPLDAQAWGAAILGIVLGLIVVAAFMLAAT